MAWHHVADETTIAPVHALEGYRDRKGNHAVHIGKDPTGETVEKVFAIWRCGNCRAIAVLARGDGPLPAKPSSNCMKCGAKG